VNEVVCGTAVGGNLWRRHLKLNLRRALKIYVSSVSRVPTARTIPAVKLFTGNLEILNCSSLAKLCRGANHAL
jgi:hypothetical protein